LTGLPNRSLFFDALNRQLASAEAAGEEVLLQLFDIDRFRMINDLHGRDGADRLIGEIAGRIRSSPVRPKIKLDENIPATLASLLSGLGHDPDTVPREGLTGKADQDVWYASQLHGVPKESRAQFQCVDKRARHSL
jgi:hypothetical protein